MLMSRCVELDITPVREGVGVRRGEPQPGRGRANAHDPAAWAAKVRRLVPLPLHGEHQSANAAALAVVELFFDAGPQRQPMMWSGPT